ncbi:MAG: fibronectin type III domain-containing protein [Elusimicrobia bacterium]|nr:fibronectin type III domain-containing protein [Elusimicrobiota bacterium]
MHFRQLWKTPLTALASLPFLSLAALAASFEPRINHTSTLLPSGDILIVGGQQPGNGTQGVFLSTVQISLGYRGQDILDAPSLSVARASHTAVLLPNGEVLVAGGKSGPLAADVVASVVSYNPVGNCWRPAVAATGRHSHTATLLNDSSRGGQVLICGGFNSAGNALSSCELFTPAAADPTCATAPGAISAGPSMVLARAAHSATLLPDHKVFFAGGYNAAVSPPYLSSTESYDPAVNSFGARQPLSQARAYHTATLMGDGKVLLAGGYNGRYAGNHGIIETVELYSPLNDTVQPLAPMQERRMGHTASLMSDGKVEMVGGLGNITTTFVNLSGPLDEGSFITSTNPGPLTTMTVTGGNLLLDTNFKLSVEATGIIEQGVVLFSTPRVNFAGGVLYMPNGIDEVVETSTFNLAGTRVGCEPPAFTTCGKITRTFDINPRGYFVFTPRNVAPIDAVLAPVSTAGVAAPINDQSPDSTALTGGELTFPLTIRGMPREYAGGNVRGGRLRLIGGSVVFGTTVTITITGGVGTFSGSFALSDDGNDTLRFTVPAFNLKGLAGTAATSTTTLVGPTWNLALGGNTEVTGLAGVLDFQVDRVDLGGDRFEIGIATVIVRRMMFGDREIFDPELNQWTFGDRITERYNHTATLIPNGDLFIVGGRACNDPNVLESNCPLPDDLKGRVGIIPKLADWNAGASMNGPRANHTSTVLPDGRILVAGGNNGPNVLRSSDLFDPVTRSFSAAGTLRDARDLHTATLLPSGRVLVAGGFSTNELSTGSISRAEIFYVESMTWAPTSPMSSPRDSHGAVLLADGNVLVTGGYITDVGYLDSAEIYITTAGIWVPVASMSAARALHSATLLQDGRVLVVGGIASNGLPQGTVEIYDPASNSWSAGAPIASVFGHRATLLPDGRVLITGGKNSFGETNHSVIYDPRANAWSNTGNAINASRFDHTAMLLPSGVVMITGGHRSLSGNSLATVETYSISADSWQIVGQLAQSRAAHTVAIARDGNVFAIGGVDGVNSVNSLDFIYFAPPPDLRTFQNQASLRLSSITALDASRIDRGQSISLRGGQFLGMTEASGGGAASANSHHQHPRVVLQSLESSGGSGSQGQSGFFLDLSTAIFSNTANLWSRLDSSITVRIPVASDGVRVPLGWYHLWAGVNAQYSGAQTLQIGPAKPSAAPTNIVANTVTIGSDTVTYSWTAPAGSFDGYNVYWATNAVFLATTTAASASLTLRGLDPNTTTQIMVAAYNLMGDGPLGLSATYFTLSTAPVNPAISEVSANSVRLDWGSNRNTLATIYEVSLSTDNFSAHFSTPVPSLLGRTTNTALISELQANTTYSFRIRAFNGAGVPSNFSVRVSTRTRAPISGVTGNAQSTTQIEWNWTDPGGVSFYRVFNATAGILIGNSATNVFQDTGLSTNTSRSIIVQAVTSAGEGPLTHSATVYTLAAPPGTASPAVTSVSTGGLTVNWSANDNPLNTSYIAQAFIGGSLAASMATTQFSASFTGISTAALPVSVQIRAVNGDGLPSADLSIATVSTLANPPSNLTLLGTTPNSITIGWSGNNNSSSATYQVTISSDNFTANVSTPLAFLRQSNQTSLLISGLFTSTTYTIRVAAQNLDGVATAFSNSLTTSPFNGGVAFGSLGGSVPSLQNTVIEGNLGNGRLVGLQVPAGAFSSDVFVTISSITIPPSLCGSGLAAGISITVAPGFQPVRPVFLTMSYTDAEVAGAPVNELSLARVDDSGACVPLRTSIDQAGRRLTAQLNHFSLFQVVRLTPAAAPDSARVFPNPFYPSQGQGYVTFASMPASARVRIFTGRGELVFDDLANASGLLTWNGNNRAGRPVASGVYLVVVESGGSKKTLKLVVLR